MKGKKTVGTRHFWRNPKESLLNYLYSKAFVYVSETQVMVKKICNECGLSVALGSGWFVNRVPDLNDMETRMENGKHFPEGDFICAECDVKSSEEVSE